MSSQRVRECGQQVAILGAGMGGSALALWLRSSAPEELWAVLQGSFGIAKNMVHQPPGQSADHLHDQTVHRVDSSIREETAGMAESETEAECAAR